MVRYNLLLAKCAETGAWQTAIAAYRSMSAKDDTFTGDGKLGSGDGNHQPFPGPTVYRHLLRAAKNATPPRPRTALSVLTEMRRRGISPSVSDYNIVVSACARAAAAVGTTGIDRPTAGCLSKASCTTDNSQTNDRGVDYIENEDVAGGRDTSADVGDGLGRLGFGGREYAPGNVLDDDGINAIDTSNSSSGCSLSRRDGMTSFKGAHRSLCNTGQCKTSSRLPNLIRSCVAASTSNDSRGEALGVHCCPRCSMCDISSGTNAEPTTAREAMILALDVFVNMRENKVRPTKVTYKTLVEVGRCCANGPAIPRSAVVGEKRQEQMHGSESGLGVLLPSACSPSDVYTKLKMTGIPDGWCYDAGIGNALKGGRRYPAYVAQAYR